MADEPIDDADWFDEMEAEIEERNQIGRACAAKIKKCFDDVSAQLSNEDAWGLFEYFVRVSKPPKRQKKVHTIRISTRSFSQPMKQQPRARRSQTPTLWVRNTIRRPKPHKNICCGCDNTEL
jgi:hypothetical protein